MFNLITLLPLLALSSSGFANPLPSDQSSISDSSTALSSVVSTENPSSTNSLTSAATRGGSATNAASSGGSATSAASSVGSLTSAASTGGSADPTASNPSNIASDSATSSGAPEATAHPVAEGVSAIQNGPRHSQPDIYSHVPLPAVQIQSGRDGRCLSPDPRYDPAPGAPVDMHYCVNSADAQYNAKAWDVTPGQGSLVLSGTEFIMVVKTPKGQKPNTYSSLVLEYKNTTDEFTEFYVTNDYRISVPNQGKCLSEDRDLDGSAGDTDRGLILWECVDWNTDQMFWYLNKDTQNTVPIAPPADAYAPGVDLISTRGTILPLPTQPSSVSDAQAFQTNGGSATQPTGSSGHPTANPTSAASSGSVTSTNSGPATESYTATNSVSASESSGSPSASGKQN